MNPQVIEQSQVEKLLPERPKDSHKGLFGTVAVIGGASGMTGAALLAGRAALKLGAGCVHVVLLADNAPSVDLVQPELMLHKADSLFSTCPLPNPPPHAGEEANVKWGKQVFCRKTKTRRNIFNSDVLAIGCGMGSGELAGKLLAEALRSTATLVLDADALNLIAAHPDLRDLAVARKAATVLTPHPGEAARLLNCSTAEVQKDRVAAIQKLARMFACSVVLKGTDSLCATRRGLFVNKTGNPGMSGPGMGDVLTGMIAALLAQGLNADDALLLAVHLHGAAGDELAKYAAVGMTATELTDQARRLLNQWRTN
ncbi:MAG: NAD(P)H-hydrate dehydratase [Gallionella sp.]|nr:NAD(P)H-hydrate dehydratase [Gallionella sp.]